MGTETAATDETTDAADAAEGDTPTPPPSEAVETSCKMWYAVAATLAVVGVVIFFCLKVMLSEQELDHNTYIPGMVYVAAGISGSVVATLCYTLGKKGDVLWAAFLSVLFTGVGIAAFLVSIHSYMPA